MPATLIAHWIGGSGNWSDISHWDIGKVPNNGAGDTYTAVIDLAGSSPTITSNQDVTITSLQSTEALVISGGTFTVNGGASSSSGALSLGAATLTATGSGISFSGSGPTAIGAATDLLAFGGATLSLLGATSYAPGADGINNQHAVWRAEGTGSVLDLRNVTSITGGLDYDDQLSIEAATGGKVDLRSATTLLTPAGGNQNYRSIDVSAQGAGSVVDLTALTSYQDFYGGVTNGDPRYSHLTPSSGGVITAPALTSVRGILVTSRANITFTTMIDSAVDLASPLVLADTETLNGSGTVEFGVTNAGHFAATVPGGTLSVDGPLSNTGILEALYGGTLDINGTLTLTDPGHLNTSPSSTLSISGNFLGSTQSIDSFNPLGIVRLDGAGSTIVPQLLEVMSRDLGTAAAGFDHNFVFGTLALANSTRVQLVDQSDNASGAGAEAIYVNSLIVPVGTTLDLNGLHLYTRAAQIAGNIVGGAITQIADSGPLAAGTPTPGVIGVAGELDEWTFFGRGGHTLAVIVNPGSTGSSPAITPRLDFAEADLLDAAGNVLKTVTSASAGALASFNDFILPADGDYRIQIRAAAGHTANTGNYTVAFYDVRHDSTALTPNQQVFGSIETPFSADEWTFAGSLTQQVRFDLRAASSSGIVFDLTGPNGAVFTGLTADSSLITLPAAGNYVLTAHGTGEQVGDYSFVLEQISQTNLALGGTVASTLTSSGDAHLFRIDVPAGQPMRVTLDDSSTVDHNELYLKYGTPPTRGDFDLRATNSAAPDQQVIVPLATPGVWYALVYGDSVPTASNFTLSTEGSNLIVEHLTPDHHGNSAATVVTITGAGFDNTTALTLVKGATSLTPASFTVDSPTQITASFAAGIAAGTYTVHLTEPGITKDLTDAITITAGGQAHLETNLVLPSVFGRRAPATIFVEYANTGDIAMDAPLLTLYGTDHARLTLDSTRLVEGIWTTAHPAGFSDVVQILTSGEVPGVLQPGEHVRVPVYYAGIEPPFNRADNRIGFDLKVLTTDDATPVVWENFKDAMRPVAFTAAQWEPVWQNFIAASGNTLGSYVQMLDDNAGYLGRVGERVLDVSSLIGFEYQQADGISPVQNLATATDISLDAPGLDLVFSRVFQNGIADRNDTGDFGYGWSSNWDVNLAKAADGTVTITGTGGSTRTFQPDSRPGGGYFAQDGDHGVFTALSAAAGGGYSLVEPDGLLKRFGTDGHLLYLEDTNGNRITTGYTSGHLSTLTHSSGRSLTLAWNAAGHIQSITDSLGEVTQFTYDAAGTHLTGVTDIHGQTTTYSYVTGQGVAKEHALTAIAYPGGTHQFFSYDASGHLTGTSRDDGPDADTLGDEALAFAYHDGRVSVTDALSATTDFFFDYRGLLVKTRDPLGTSVLSSFDHRFNLTGITDADGQHTGFTYDAKGNLLRSVDALGSTTSFTYGALNRLASFTDASGNVTRYGYDSHGNLLTTTDASGSVERATYDPLGELDVLTNHRGDPIDYDYDTAGHLTRKTFSDGTHTDYFYDAKDRLDHTTDASGTTQFAYDSADRLQKVTYPNGRFLQFTYDAGGHRTQSVDQDGFTVKYSYDAVGRLTDLKDDSGGNIVHYTYDSASQLTRKENGNGTYTTYESDNAGQLLHLVNRAPDNSVQSRFDYTYDARGQRITMGTVDGDWAYSYDATGQLTHAVFHSTNAAVADLDLSYVYDAAGNRIRTIENGVTTNSTTNNLNQYTQVGSAVLTYDADGNLVRKVDGANVSTYTYNVENRLIGVVTPNGTWTYQYDSLGNRVSMLRDGVRTDYLIDPGGLGAVATEYLGAGTAPNHYTYGLGLVNTITNTGSASFYLFDGTGNTAGRTNSVGISFESYRFDPFGKVVSGAVPQVGFSGQFGIFNDGSDLDHLRARDYDATLGRFTSTDPVRLASGDQNYYRYTSNDPINNVDPSGLATERIPGFDAGLNVFIELGRATQQIGKLIPVFGKPVQLFGKAQLGFGQAVKYVYHQFDLPDQPSPNAPNSPTPVEPTPVPVPGPGPNPRPFRPIQPLPGPFNPFDPWRFVPPPPPQPTPVPPGPPVPPVPPPLPPIPPPPEPTPLQGGIDPNALTGPAGYGTLGYVSVGSVLPYRIDFENDATAQVPAQHVAITNQLDSDLDWSTFALTEVGFGDTLIAIPGGSRHFQTTVDFTYGGQTFDVLIEAGVNAETGQVFASFQSIDPATSLPPDALTGFLPPEDGTGRGLGHVSYAIKAKPTLTTGTELSNIAQITFDSGETIATNQADPHDPSQGTDPAKEARNTIDADLPGSSITTPSGSQAKTAINLTFQSQDVGSGMAGVDVFVSQDSGAYALALSNVTGTTATYIAKPGHAYRFYSIAHDHAGNSEAAPASPDTTITLAPAQQIVLDKQHPKFSFTDDDGTAVTAVWSGKGTASLQRFDDATTHRGDLVDIAIAGSDAKSTLTITPTKGDTSVGTIQAATPLASLNLKGVNVLSGVNFASTVSTVTLGSLLNGADITITGPLAKGGAVVTLGDVSGESDLTSAEAITTLTAVRWTDGKIAAPSIGTLTVAGSKTPLIAGDFGADLTLTNGTVPLTLTTAKIAGAITGGAWNVTGNAGAISALSTAASWDAEFSGDVQLLQTTKDASGAITAKSIKTLTVGGNLANATVTLTQPVVPTNTKLQALTALTVTGILDNSSILSAGHLGALTFGALRNSRILAGVNASSTGLPDSLIDFTAAAKIASVTVKGIAGMPNAMINSNIAAQFLGAISLRDVLGANGTTDFGLAADKIAALTIYKGKSVLDKFTNLDTSPEAVRHEDFVVRVL